MSMSALIAAARKASAEVDLFEATVVAAARAEHERLDATLPPLSRVFTNVFFEERSWSTDRPLSVKVCQSLATAADKTDEGEWRPAEERRAYRAQSYYQDARAISAAAKCRDRRLARGARRAEAVARCDEMGSAAAGVEMLVWNQTPATVAELEMKLAYAIEVQSADEWLCEVILKDLRHLSTLEVRS